MATTNSLLLGFNLGNPDVYTTSSFYQSLGAQFQGRTYATETPLQIAQLAVTFSQLAVQVNTNTYGAGAASFNFRKAAGAANQTVAAYGTGWLADSTHTDSVTSGQSYDCQFTANSAGPDCLFSMLSVVTSASSPAAYYVCSGGAGNGGSTLTFSSTFQALPLIGAPGTGPVSTSGNSLYYSNPLYKAGVLSGLTTTVVVYGTALGIHITNSGTNINNYVSISALGTGVDTTHTDSVAVNAYLYYYGKTTSTSTQVSSISVAFAGHTSAHEMATRNNVSASAAYTGDTSNYSAPAGLLQAGGGEGAIMQAVMPYGLTVSGLAALVQFSSAGDTTAITMRKNSANGGGTVVLTTTASYYLSRDTTHTDSYSATDSLDIAVVLTGPGGSGILELLGLLIAVDDGSNTGSSTETSTAAMAFSGAAFSIAVADMQASQGTLAFSKASFAATANDHTGYSVMAFTGAAFAATSRRTEGPLTGVLSFTKASFTAAANDHTGHSTLALGGAAFVAAAMRTEGPSTGTLSFTKASFTASADDHTGHGVLTFTGASFTASADDHTGHGVLAFTGASFTASAHEGHAGYGSLAFTGIAITGAAVDFGVVVGGMHFSGIAISATAVFTETTVGGLHFTGISIHASASRLGAPGTGITHFWTFGA